MKTICKLLGIFFITCAAAHAQVAPAAIAAGGLPVTGNIHYAFRYSQTSVFGASQGNWQTSSPSMSVDYANEKPRHPFRVNYSGGYTWTLAGPSYSTGLFQHLLLSQAIVWRKWNLRVVDDVSYRPQSPTTGFSGISGIGEVIGSPGPNPPSSQSILTLNSRVIENTVSGEIEHGLKYGSSLNAGGGSVLLRYPDGIGIDTNTQMANAGIIWRLNARNSISSDYSFSQFSYPRYGFSFTTHSALLGIKRIWNRKITTDVTAGPQLTGSSNSNAIPSSLGAEVNAALSYQFRFDSASLMYNRGINGGAGYLFGSESDSVSANFARQFGRDLHVGVEGSYRRTAGLQNNGVTNSKCGGLQATRRMGRYFSTFANYTAMEQSSSSSLPVNALSRLMHVIGFGIEYSPRETHLRP